MTWVIALCGLGITAVLALFGAGVSWGAARAAVATSEREIARLEKRVEKLEETRSSPSVEVLRSELKSLRELMESRLDEIDKRFDRIASTERASERASGLG